MPQAHVIAILDDDASLRDAVVDLISSVGFEAYGFESAESFLRSPQVDTISCLITDVQMPGMTGPELQRHLLAQGRVLPIIFITAFPEKNTRARVTEAGALAYLEKPFDGATLLGFLQSAMLSAEAKAPG